MGKDDLIKILENVRLPDIKLKGHKARLRMELLDSGYLKDRSVFVFLKKTLVFSLPVLLILTFVLVKPGMERNRAFTIAKTDSQVMDLIEKENLVLSDLRIEDGKAYILLNALDEQQVADETVIKIKKTEEDEIGGVVIEVNLDNKKVDKLDPINWEEIMPLNNEEKESAKEIADKEEIVKDFIPEGAKVDKVESSPGKARLTKEDDKVKVVPSGLEEKKAKIHYTSNGKEWVVKVNLSRKKVEEIHYLSNQVLKGREENND